MAEPHEGRVVLHNAAFLSGLQTITYLLPVIILPYLFRTIGPEKFGLIAFAQAFVHYFMILTDYGFSITATKDISLCHDDKNKISAVFSSVMTVKTILLVLCLFILAAVIHSVPKFTNDWLVYVLSFGMVIGNTIFPVWFFQGVEKMEYIAGLNIIGEVIFASFIFIFVSSPDDYLLVPLVTSCASLATGLLGQYIVFRKFGVVFKLPRFEHLRRQLENGWNIFISIVAINAYTNTRVFAVGLLTNNSMTGFYSIAEKIANMAQTFPLSSFTQAVFPRLSKIFHKNRPRAVEMMQHIQQITVNISLICLPMIYFLSPLIIRLVCGGEYPEAVLSLQLLLISVFFVSANAFRVQFLLVSGRTDIYSKIHITMAVIGLPLVFFLISSLSYVGAAVATVVIEGGVFMLTYFWVRKLKFI